MLRTLFHFLLHGDNPVRLYGFWPTAVWVAPIVMAGVYFAIFEWGGMARYRGMIPLTYVLRCVPVLAWLAFFIWFIPHLLRHRPQ